MNDWKAEIASEISIESLPDVLQTVAETIGMKVTLQVIELLGGMCVYFPMYEKLARPTRDIHIRKEFTGSNHRELARKYSLSETQIRSIVQMRPDKLKGT